MHRYEEISHFRRPYSNYAVGQPPPPSGAPPPPATSPTQQPPQPGVPDLQLDEYLTETPDGLPRFRPEVAEAILDRLKFYNSIYLSPTRVVVEPLTPEQLEAVETNEAYAELVAKTNGARWVSDQLKKNNIVFAPISLLTSGVVPEAELGAIPATDTERLAQIAEMGPAAQTFPVLADPRVESDKDKAKEKADELLLAGFSPWVIGLGLVLVGGLVYYAWSRSGGEEEPVLVT